MHIEPIQYIVFFILLFFAGLIDSMVGGGGLISLPAYFFVGVPPHLALGTNKLSSACGTFLSTVRYIKGNSVRMRPALFAAAGALAGSPVGAWLALQIDEKYFGFLMMLMLPVVAFLVLSKKDFGVEDDSRKNSTLRMSIISLLIGLGIGAYDGFFGPGTGTFLVLAFTALLRFNLITASGNAKIVNLASNVAALATFLISGNVLFAIGLLGALFNIAGNWIGSGLALKKGVKVLRPAFIIVITLLMVKVAADLIGF